jgi:hypothetical protein
MAILMDRRAQIIKDTNFVSLVQQRIDSMRADEASAASDQDFH